MNYLVATLITCSLFAAGCTEDTEALFRAAAACDVELVEASSAHTVAVGTDRESYSAIVNREDETRLVELTIPNSWSGSIATYARYDADGGLVASATADLTWNTVLDSSLGLEDRELLGLITQRTGEPDTYWADPDTITRGLELFTNAVGW